MYYKTIAVLISSIWAVGCTAPDQPTVGEEPGAPTMEQVGEEVTEAVETASEYVSNERDEFLVRVESEVTRLNDEIKTLRNEIAEAGAESKESFNEALAAMDEKRQTAAGELEKLKSATGDAWKDVRGGMESALQELQEDYDNARSLFDAHRGPQPVESARTEPADSDE